MTDELTARLDRYDAEVQGHVERVWPEVEWWVRRLENAHVVAPGSELRADDDEAAPFSLSYLALTSLGSGSSHLMATMRYLASFGPTVTPMQSLLRTAIWGGAQAVWLLHPEERQTRINHARRVQAYSEENRLKWLNTYDADSLRDEQRISLIADRKLTKSRKDALGQSAKPDQTAVVRDVAKLTFPGQPEAPAAVEQSWRQLGAIAHAVPWELNTRQTAEIVATEGSQSHVKVTARWAELGGELSYAHEFLRLGWGLLDRRSRAGETSRV